jgi:coenzyme F420-reducing hydrogenase alpha subunit
MTTTARIRVEHLTRVEGHGNIIVNVTDGVVEKCVWQVPESPRFFESMVRGRHYSEVARITSRICGICSIGHTLASVKTTEDALGIEVSTQSWKLRELIKHAENFDSHVLHINFLAAPDLLGAPSVFPLVATHTDVVARALRLKRLGHEWGSLIGGRTTHPMSIVPGGMAAVPTTKELKQLREQLLAAVPELEATVATVMALAPNVPAFDRPTEYIALSNDKDYGLYDGDIQSTLPDGTKERYPVADYKQVTNEFVVPQSTAKYTKHKLDSYAAGALARFNNNYDRLHPKAKEVAEALGIQPICTNPYMNTVAQVVEIASDVYESVALLDELIDTDVQLEPLVEPTKYGSGAGATEVPRGILFHEYDYDDEGMCLGGNCIIPTNQNHNNIQHDFEKLVPELVAQDKSETEMELALEMLVRSYDPCISCSTHYLDVKFVR